LFTIDQLKVFEVWKWYSNIQAILVVDYFTVLTHISHKCLDLHQANN